MHSDSGAKESAKTRRKAPLLSSRVVLMAGFGGLLLLMAFAQIDGINVLRRIQTANDDSRKGFLLRTRVLERIRGDLYVSGTYVRDYLSEREPGKAEGHRYSLLETRSDMDSALSQYRALLNEQELQPFQALNRELAEYWSVLQPALQWSAAEREKSGYDFLRDEIFPRRMAMLRIADRIARLNESQVQSATDRLDAIFGGFRNRLTGLTGLTIGLGFALAFFTTYRILRLEEKTAVHYREISSTRAELQQLSARLVAAQETERRTISRELHDEVGQALTGALVEMANASNLIRARNLEAAAGKTDEVKKLIEGSITVVRNMALLLRPSMLDDLGLVPALEWQAREAARLSGLRVKVVAEDVPEELPDEYKTCIYRVVQEALHNCIKHSEAQNATVTVRREAKELNLAIEDDGKGFDSARNRGLGLLGMQERVSFLGGVFSARSVPGKGVTIRVTLPLNGQNGQNARKAQNRT